MNRFRKISRWHGIDERGEAVYTIPFQKFEDARNFTRLIARNSHRFTLICCRKGDVGWVVIYRPHQENIWSRGGAHARLAYGTV